MDRGEKERSTFNYKESLKTSTSGFFDKHKYIDLYVNRPIAALIVKLVYNTPVTPNMITYLSFLIGLLGAYLFTKGDYQYFIWGGFLAQVSSIVDGADGMLARAKNITTSYGAHLDLFFDRIIDFCLFLGVAIGAGTYYQSSQLQFLGTLLAGLYLLQANLFYILKKFHGKKTTGETGEMRAIWILGMFILALFNRLDLIIYLGVTATLLIVVVRTFYFIVTGVKKN